MQWETCYSDRRSGTSKTREIPRTEYQRDYDRLIFASSFRRLQNKTQVFPLPGSTFVHNRLTHSLEVASVGRTIGKVIGDHIAREHLDLSDSGAIDFYRYDLSSVIAAACLAHDIGNPAFGHSGEKAISNYFIENADLNIEGHSLRSFFDDREWQDLINFEGNANALRVLTHQFRDKPIGGMTLTMTTLASILKYPCESIAVDRHIYHRKKYGFFQSETSTFRDIVDELGMISESDDPLIYKRHPFVYMVEAADDICYRIIDMEDAHRLHILNKGQVSNAYLAILEGLTADIAEFNRITATFHKIMDDNDSVAYLRAKTINALTLSATEVFITQQNDILKGQFNSTLLKHIEADCSALTEVMNLSIEKIYQHHSVIEIEITGYHVMSHLLNLFVPAVLRKQKKGTDKMALQLIPFQFKEYETSDRPYVQVQSVVDYISGMTDAYATEFYRKTTGIDISKHV